MGSQVEKGKAHFQLPGHEKQRVPRRLAQGAWKADEKGMEGLLGDMKTLSIGTTGFPEEFYKTTGVGDAVNKLIGTVLWSFGIQTYEIVNLYGVQTVDDETRKNYLEQVYRLGKEF